MKKLILILMLFVFASLTYASETTQFTAALNFENLSFTGNENITRYLSIPSYSTLSGMNLTLKHHNVSSSYYEYDETLDQINFTGTWLCSDGSLLSAYDSNYSTHCNKSGTESTMNINYTIPNNATAAIWQIKDDTGLYNVSIGSQCWTTNKLQMEITVSGSTLYLKCKEDGGAEFYSNEAFIVYEEAMHWIPYQLNDTYLEIGDPDNTYEWGNTGQFTGNITIANATTTINNVLNNECNCTGCTLSNNNCSIPFMFHSNNLGTLEYLDLNFSFHTNKTITLKFYSELTKQLIDYATISAEMISDSLGINKTTANGSVDFDVIMPDTYTIRFDANGFVENFYYLTLNNKTHENIDLYLLNDTDASNITATVYDLQGNTLEDVYIKAHRYNIVTNSYELVSEAKTNFNGVAIIPLVKNTEYYKFFLYYPLDTLREETSPTYIYSDTINFQISIGDAVAETYFKSQDITYSLTFNNVTNNFRYTFSDPNTEIEQACLDIYEINFQGNTLLNTTCVTGSSGTILTGLTVKNDTEFLAKAVVYYDGSSYILDELSQKWFSQQHMGNMGVFGIMAITLIFLFVAFFKPALGVVLAPLPTIYGSVSGIINLSIFVAVGLEIIAIIIAIIIAKE